MMVTRFFISNSFISNSSTFRKKIKQLTSRTRKFLATDSQILRNFFGKMQKNGEKPLTGEKFWKSLATVKQLD